MRERAMCERQARYGRLARALGALAGMALASGLAATEARGQSIEESIGVLTEQNASRYIEPLTAGLGAALNTGFYHTARVHEVLGFDLGVRAMGAFVPSEMDVFVPVLPESVDFEGTGYTNPYAPAGGSDLTSPSVSGEGEGILLVPQGAFRQALIDAGEDPDAFNIRFPRGFDIPIVPYAAIQGAVGVPLGTEVVFRFIPSFTPDGDVGSISMVGGAVKHSLSQWFPTEPPIDLALAFGFQHFSVGSYLDANATQLSLVASRKLAIVTVYAAGTVEDADLDVSYVLTSPLASAPGTQEVTFTQDTPNSTTLALGATLQIGGLGVHVEYALGSYDVLSAGLLFSVR